MRKTWLLNIARFFYFSQSDVLLRFFIQGLKLQVGLKPHLKLSLIYDLLFENFPASTGKIRLPSDQPE
jgi:hypothetical protein